MILRYLNELDAAKCLEGAVVKVASEGKRVTYDLKPKPDDPTVVGTSEMADAIVGTLKEI